MQQTINSLKPVLQSRETKPGRPPQPEGGTKRDGEKKVMEIVTRAGKVTAQ